LDEITTVSDGGASTEGVLLLGNSIFVRLLLVDTTLLSDSVSGAVISSPDDLDLIDSAHSTSEVGDGRYNDTTNASNDEGVLSSCGGDSITVSLESINLELVRSVNVVKLEAA